jgi:hypothetical protein
LGDGPAIFVLAAALTLVATSRCSSEDEATTHPSNKDGGIGAEGGTGPLKPTNPQDGPPAGYPDGHGSVPAEGQAEDVSSPTTVIGDGTPASCTGDAFVAAVAKGGVITFNCGPDPVTIVLSTTAKVFNDRGTKLVIDGGNKVTLSGGGKRAFFS